MNLNKVLIIGRLTVDPEIRTTPSGDRVTTLNIATNRVWNDKSGSKKESTEFHNAVLWGRQADIACQFLVKGSIVFIEGRLQTRKWQDKEGTTRKTTEIIGERIQLGPRPDRGIRNEGNGLNRSNNYRGENGEDIGHSDEIKEDIPIIEMEGDDEIKPENLPF